MLGTAGFGGGWLAGGSVAASAGFTSTTGAAAALVRRVGSVRLSDEITGERRIEVISGLQMEGQHGKNDRSTMA
jgi:hypothetical protein